jgi:hypothetical protein
VRPWNAVFKGYGKGSWRQENDTSHNNAGQCMLCEFLPKIHTKRTQGMHEGEIAENLLEILKKLDEGQGGNESGLEGRGEV